MSTARRVEAAALPLAAEQSPGKVAAEGPVAHGPAGRPRDPESLGFGRLMTVEGAARYLAEGKLPYPEMLLGAHQEEWEDHHGCFRRGRIGRTVDSVA